MRTSFGPPALDRDLALRRRATALLLLVGVGLGTAPRRAHGQELAEVRGLAMGGRLDEARAILERTSATQGTSSTYLEARSWLARGELARGDYERALADADLAFEGASTALAARPGALDADKHLATALGAAIEVHAQAQAARGERDRAVDYLRDRLGRFGTTPIATRVQKNLHLLSLEGRPAPAILATDVLGPPLPAAKPGRPRLLYFWAHWCPDCKAGAAAIGRLASEVGPRGLDVVAPTRPYGFVAGGEEAAPAVERAYIDEVRRRDYAALGDVPAPLGESNFRAWGASTTPTVALVDGGGVVRFYHPGAVGYDALRARVLALLGPAGKRGPVTPRRRSAAR